MLKQLQIHFCASHSIKAVSKILCVSLLSFFLLSQCSNLRFPGVYKIDVRQGNIVSQDLLDTLKPQMSANQVKYILGAPLITDTFNENRWDYYYSLKTGETGETQHSQVTIFFNDAGYSHYQLLGEIEADRVRKIPRTAAPKRKKFLGIF
jgi:outer membrane protein assembly factor BamE